MCIHLDALTCEAFPRCNLLKQNPSSNLFSAYVWIREEAPEPTASLVVCSQNNCFCFIISCYFEKEALFFSFLSCQKRQRKFRYWLVISLVENKDCNSIKVFKTQSQKYNLKLNLLFFICFLHCSVINDNFVMHQILQRNRGHSHTEQNYRETEKKRRTKYDGEMYSWKKC